MCGRYNIIDSPQVHQLMDIVGVKLSGMRFSSDIPPGSRISIIRETASGASIITLPPPPQWSIQRQLTWPVDVV